MRKLVWQNANGEEINLTSGDFGITNWEGFSNAPLNIQSQQVPFQDGSVFLDALIENRELNVTLAIQDGNDLEKRYQYQRQLNHTLNPKLGEGYLIYTNDYISKRIKCIPQIPLFPNKNSNEPGTQKASLSWTACEPYWEDIEERKIYIDLENVTKVDYLGDEDIQPNIEVFPDSRNSNELIIENSNNQTEFKMKNIENFPLSIDMNFGKKTVYKQLLKEKDLLFDFYSVGKVKNYYMAISKIFNGNVAIFKTQDGYKFELLFIIPDVLTISGVEYFNEGLIGLCRSTRNILIITENGYNFYENTLQLQNIRFSEVSNKFIAYDNSYKIYKSEDCINWIYVTRIYDTITFPKPFYAEINGVVYDFFICESNVVVGFLYENDSFTTLFSDTGAHPRDFCMFNNFLFVGGNNCYYKEPNATSWNEATGNWAPASGYKFLITNKMIFWVQEHSPNSFIICSFDGKKWHNFINGQMNIETACNINELFFIYNTIGWWNEKNGYFKLPIDLKGIEKLNNFYYLLDGNSIKKNNKISITGWNNIIDIENSLWLKKVNNLLFVGTSNGKIYYSENGENWNSLIVLNSGNVVDIDYFNGTYYIAHELGVYKSINLNDISSVVGVTYIYKIFVNNNRVIILRRYENTFINESYDVEYPQPINTRRIYLSIEGSDNSIFSYSYNKKTDILLFLIDGKMYYNYETTIPLIDTKSSYVGDECELYAENDKIIFWENKNVTILNTLSSFIKYITNPYNNGIMNDKFSLYGNMFYVDDYLIIKMSDYNIILTKLENIDNLINKVTDMNLKIDVGENTIIKNNKSFLELKYRQKYIGV